MDISAVSAGLRVDLSDDQRIDALRLCFGGIGATPTRLRSLESTWVGQAWNETTIEEIALKVDEVISPISDHRASESYRRRLVKNYIRGFYFETLNVNQPLLPQQPGTSFDEGQL